MGSLTSKIVNPIIELKQPEQTDDGIDFDSSEDALEAMECDISLDLDDTPNKYQVSELDLSSFPFSHPRVFSQMLLSLDSRSLLSLRLVCSTWLKWMDSCKVWSKVLPFHWQSARLEAGEAKVTNMRLDRLESLPCDTEEDCRQLCIRLDRVAREEVPPIEEGRIHLAEQLQLAADMDQIDGPVVGPVEVFVRVKVDHPVVKKIVKENIVRYINSILVDETDQRALMMWRRFPVLCTEGAMMPVDFYMEEIGEKEDVAENQEAKRIRLDEDLEDEEEEENLTRIDEPVRINPKFPTLLELIDFDDPIIKQMLVHKTGIDKILLCPRFNDVLSQPSSCLDSTLKVQGVGLDGKVCEVDLSILKEEDVAIMGYHINQCFNPRDQAKNLVFWGGPDIRHNWPEFSQQLQDMDSNIHKKYSPPKRSNVSPVETEACVARLAARGLLINKGEKEKLAASEPAPREDTEEPFYPFSSIAASDPFSANPVNEQLCASFAARGLSLSLAGPSRRINYHAGEGEGGATGAMGNHENDQPGDVIIYDRTAGGTSGQGASGLRAMLEARGLLRVEGGRAVLRMQRPEEQEEEEEESEESDWEEEEETEEDDSEAEEWYRNYVRQRELEAQGGRSQESSDDSMPSIPEDSMPYLPEDDGSDRITEQLDIIVSQGATEGIHEEKENSNEDPVSLSEDFIKEIISERIDDFMDKIN